MRRTLAGHGSAPPATGWEGEVRKVLKEDWQVVCGIMGFYTTLYLVSKLFSGGKKAAPDTGTSRRAGIRWSLPQTFKRGFRVIRVLHPKPLREVVIRFVNLRSLPHLTP